MAISPQTNLWFGCRKISNSSISVGRGSVFFYDGIDRFKSVESIFEKTGEQYFIPQEVIEIPEDLNNGFRVYCRITLSITDVSLYSMTILANQYAVENIDENYEFILSRFGKYSTLTPTVSGDELSNYEYVVYSDSDFLPAKTDEENAAGIEYIYIPICQGRVTNSVLSYKQLFAGLFIINRQQYHYGTEV